MTLTLLAGLVVGVGYAQPKWLAALGMDFWNLPALEDALAKNRQMSEHLDEVTQDAQHRAAQKNVIVERLVNEQLTLAEATAQILQVCDDHLLKVGCEILELEGKTHEESVCRLVVFWATIDMPPDSEQGAKLKARLETELQDYIAQIK
jgi:hypothetical protein